MARFLQIGAALACVLAAACNTPAPRTWLRFRPDGPTNWTTDAAGLLVGRLHGTDVTVDLGRPQTRVQVTVANNTAASVEFRMGPEGGAPRSAIGQVLLRPLDGPPGVTGSDMLPYNALQPQAIAAGWRGTFFIDTPLGREVTLGQTFVLTVEARNAAGAVERRTLPLNAINAGTIPLDGR